MRNSKLTTIALILVIVILAVIITSVIISSNTKESVNNEGDDQTYESTIYNTNDITQSTTDTDKLSTELTDALDNTNTTLDSTGMLDNPEEVVDVFDYVFDCSVGESVNNVKYYVVDDDKEVTSSIVTTLYDNIDGISVDYICEAEHIEYAFRKSAPFGVKSNIGNLLCYTYNNKLYVQIVEFEIG